MSEHFSIATRCTHRRRVDLAVGHRREAGQRQHFVARALGDRQRRRTMRRRSAADGRRSDSGCRLRRRASADAREAIRGRRADDGKMRNMVLGRRQRHANLRVADGIDVRDCGSRAGARSRGRARAASRGGTRPATRRGGCSGRRRGSTRYLLVQPYWRSARTRSASPGSLVVIAPPSPSAPRFFVG